MRFLNRVKQQTPESVELEFTLAGIGNRAYALLIDYIVWGLILMFFLFAWAYLSIQIVELWNDLIGDQKRLELWLISLQIFILFAIYVGYFVLFEVLWQGQTPGKRFAKIRVICDDGRPIRLPQATLRALLRPVDELFFCVGFLFIILGKQEKRLGDLVAGTIVIQESSKPQAAKLIISEPAKILAKELPSQANLSVITSEDFAVIREYLQRRQVLTPEAKVKLGHKLAEQLKARISLENSPPQVSDSIFLEAVYLIYSKEG